MGGLGLVTTSEGLIKSRNFRHILCVRLAPSPRHPLGMVMVLLPWVWVWRLAPDDPPPAVVWGWGGVEIISPNAIMCHTHSHLLSHSIGKTTRTCAVLATPLKKNHEN